MRESQPRLLLDEEPTPVPAPPSETDRYTAILFGRDTTTRLVAAEHVEDRLLLWRRDENGLVTRTAERVPLWLLTLTPTALLEQTPRELVGEGYRFLYEFSHWSAFQDARFRLRDTHTEHMTYATGVKNALIRTGKTLFLGMTMEEVVRMQVDIETEGLSPEGENGRILIIAVRDNRGLLETITGDERTMLNEFVALVRERDPDVIEGHNIYGFDFPFLMARAQRHGVRLALGRDGSEVRAGQERNFAIGGISRPFVPVYLFGRHVMDTYLAVQRFDWAKGALSSYGLKQVAQAFGIAEAERVEMPRAELAQIFQDDRERVLTYAKHDVIETGRLAELVCPTEFYQAQMVPDSYGGSAVSGNGEKINAIFVRAYLAEGHAIPRSQAARGYAGGYSEVRISGVLDRVVKADVESLYPSLMLAEKICPANDTLDVFLPALAELTRRRLEAKARVREAEGTEEHYWDGLQGSFKVLINSFYGYLGASGFYFNDYDAAERVTELGRELVVRIADEMERTGSRIIEIDTDGVYFVPPDTVQGEDAERAYVKQVGGILPAGIRLAFDGRFRAMVSLKTKNYVLFGYDGKKTYKGASLRSRADEKYGREFLAQAIDLLLEHRMDAIAALYERTIEDIRQHRLPIEQLARRERVTDKTFTSSSKLRSAEVARGVAVGEYVTVYEKQDRTLGLLEDYDPQKRDENAAYYMDKLYKFAGRLREAFPDGTFDALIPKPTAQGLPPKQASFDLFSE
jgi:DNA polymerase elongation subunit (family B)